jgi:hypothetical protein
MCKGLLMTVFFCWIVKVTKISQLSGKKDHGDLKFEREEDQR